MNKLPDDLHLLGLDRSRERTRRISACVFIIKQLYKNLYMIYKSGTALAGLTVPVPMPLYQLRLRS